MYLESITGDVVAKALDVSVFSHKVIAHNIANAGVRGYIAGKVNFSDIMQDVKKLMDIDADETDYKHVLESIKEEDMVIFSENDKGVSIDHEMMSLAENTIRYQALLRARTELGEILKSAITGGGRG